MADSIKFTIGGKLGPSYRGALAQAEVEALRANAEMGSKVSAQQARIAALDKAYAKAGPGSAEASALAMQQYPKRMAMEKELQLMQLKYNLTALADARKIEAEKAAAAELSDAEQIAANKTKLATIIAQEREAAVVEMAMQDAVTNAQLADEAEKAAAANAGSKLNSTAIRESIVILRELAAGRGFGRVAASATVLAQNVWKGFLAAVISIPGLVAIAGAAVAYFTLRHLKALNEALDKTGELLEKALGDRARANFEALKESAVAAADFTSWLEKLGHTQETLAVQTDEAIAALREQFSLMRQIAGSDKAGDLKAEQVERRSELAMVDKNLESQKSMAGQSRTAAVNAEEQAYGSKEAVERMAALKDFPNEISSAEENVKKFTELQKELQDKVDAANQASRKMILERAHEGTVPYTKKQIEQQLERAFAANTEKVFVTKSGESMSLDMAAGELDKNRNVVKSRRTLEIEMEGVQRKLVDALREAKDKADRDNQAVERLTKERDKLSDAIELHARLDPIVQEDQEFQKTLGGKSRAEQEALLKKEIAKHKRYADFYRSIGDPSADLSAKGEDLEAGKLSQQLEKLETKAPSRNLPLSEMEKAGLFQSNALIRTHDTLVESLKELKGIRRNTGNIQQPGRQGRPIF